MVLQGSMAFDELGFSFGMAWYLNVLPTDIRIITRGRRLQSTSTTITFTVSTGSATASELNEKISVLGQLSDKELEEVFASSSSDYLKKLTDVVIETVVGAPVGDGDSGGDNTLFIIIGAVVACCVLAVIVYKFFM